MKPYIELTTKWNEDKTLFMVGKIISVCAHKNNTFVDVGLNDGGGVEVVERYEQVKKLIDEATRKEA